ncbi:hypothetical protein [Kineosporia sp. NBRC 101731]|uniref:hypothetical protein n=1 Tax=Kineosporia sp. NBRC 101731 TaxID=3032199 RepID=UPI0024A105A8|nr:hypothetical protein [Kineosporia sp. NBRC 101731]GLY32040.1 hypothetical protein Kisp02_54050 [Kineosporia sp. NBRC 101731]
MSDALIIATSAVSGAGMFTTRHFWVDEDDCEVPPGDPRASHMDVITAPDPEKCARVALEAVGYEALKVERDALAAQLDQYRAWLVEMLNELEAVRFAAAGDRDTSVWSNCDFQHRVLSPALKRLDEITGKGAPQ